MPGTNPAPQSTEHRDFRFVGIIWFVKVSQGWCCEVYSLAGLRQRLESGRMQGTDLISHDQQIWHPIAQVPDLDAWFDAVWQRAAQGQHTAASSVAAVVLLPEDDLTMEPHCSRAHPAHVRTPATPAQDSLSTMVVVLGWVASAVAVAALAASFLPA